MFLLSNLNTTLPDAIFYLNLNKMTWYKHDKMFYSITFTTTKNKIKSLTFLFVFTFNRK